MRSLLWIDCTAGLVVGVLVLALAPWLSALYGLPLAVVRVMGVTNLAYGSFSYSLARRATRPAALIAALVVANGAWAALCIVAAVVLASRITAIGTATLVFEGMFVGTLAALEWRNRGLLADGTARS